MKPEAPREKVAKVGRAVAIVVFLTIIFTVFLSAVPGLVGADASYVVLSSSMSPAISAGDLVLVNDVSPEAVEEGDIITYQKEGDSGDEPVTHRVIEVSESNGERRFTTKGDANDRADRETVPPSNVVGKVWFSVPLVGYIVAFGNTKLGLVTLVVIPAILLAVSELWDLYRSDDVKIQVR